MRLANFDFSIVISALQGRAAAAEWLWACLQSLSSDLPALAICALPGPAVLPAGLPVRGPLVRRPPAPPVGSGACGSAQECIGRFNVNFPKGPFCAEFFLSGAGAFSPSAD